MTWGSQPSADTGAIWTPTRCNQAVQERLRDMRGLRVRGEVSGPRLSRGHLYFELKDTGARLRCTAWRTTVERQGIELRPGQEIICHGYVDLWVAGGAYSLIVTQVEQAGIGERWAELQRLTAQLESEGLFQRKRPLPALPRCVGIVTARTGAALQDMLRVLHERYPVRIVIAPAQVQGQGASESIAASLRALDESGLCDVLIVGRGGGSIEDLWAFNMEPVARAIAACRTPVVSAVGHESDTLLSDRVADWRAATPSVAAERVVPRMVDLRFSLREASARMSGVMTRRLLTDRRHVDLLTERLGNGDALVARRRDAVDNSRVRLAAAQGRRLARLRRSHEALRARLHRAHPVRQLGERRRRLDLADAALRAALQRRLGAARAEHHASAAALRGLAVSGALLNRQRRQLEQAAALLRGLDPRAALGRGYSIARDAETGVAVRDAAQITVGQSLAVVLARGAVDVRVERVHLIDEASL